MGGHGGEGPLFGVGGADGRGLGSGILLQGAQVISLAALPGGTLTVSDVIADAPLAGSGAGAGGLAIGAGGRVVLAAADGFAGGVALADGAVLELVRAASAGTGAIRFAAGPSTLRLDDPTALAAQLRPRIGKDDAIVLRDLSATTAWASLDAAERVLRVGGVRRVQAGIVLRGGSGHLSPDWV